MIREKLRTSDDAAHRRYSIDEDGVRRAVRAALLEQFGAMGRTQPDQGRGPTPAESAQLVQWLAPVLRSLVLESLQSALSLYQPAAATPTVIDAEPSVTLAANRAAAPAATAAQPQAVVPDAAEYHDPARNFHSWETASVSLADLELPPNVNGQFTIVAGPFDKFSQVRGFMDDIARVPRIVEVKPKSFTNGQLVAVLQSEYTDVQTLVDRLTTDLAPYRVVIRSVQAGAIEMLVRQAAR